MLGLGLCEILISYNQETMYKPKIAVILLTKHGLVERLKKFARFRSS